MPRLKILLLGPFQARIDDRVVTGFRSDKTRALLARLAMHTERPHARAALAAVLWPDYSNVKAMTYLRSAISNLGQILQTSESGAGAKGTPFLLVTRHTIQLNPRADIWVDALVALDKLTAVPAINAMEGAVALFRGQFLEGFSLADSPAFDEWLFFEREHLNYKLREALHLLAGHYIEHGRHEQAEECARSQLVLDPFNEAAHRQLMLALALEGQRSAALAQFEACQRLLRDEVGVPPEPATAELYEQIRDSKLPSGPLPTGRIVPQAAPGEPPTFPFVARERELGQLLSRMGLTLQGHGRVAFVIGDAGSGKTALLNEFTHRAKEAHPDAVVVYGRCSAFDGRGDPYLPFRDVLQALASDQVAGLAASGLHDALLDSGSAVREQRDLFDHVAGLLLAAAAHAPVILLLDDLQWADAGSIGLLFHLGRRIGRSRLMIVACYRPEDVAATADAQRNFLQGIVHELQRELGDAMIDLNQMDGRQFIDALLDSAPNDLSAEFRTTLFNHTEGHPLFTVELLYNLRERGDLVQGADGRWVERAKPNWERLPPRIEAVIAERLDRLPTEWLALLEIASVEGEVFTAEVIARLATLDERQLLWALSEFLGRQHRLVHADATQRTGPDQVRLSQYRFTHAMYQRYVYNSLDAVQRSYAHERVGKALEALYHSITERIAVTLAWHFEQAGILEKAIHYRKLAGDRALRLAAYEEAVGHYLSGLALLAAAPDAAQHDELEANLRFALSGPLLMMSGWGNTAAHNAVTRAYELFQTTGVKTQLMSTMLVLATTTVGKGQLKQARDLGEALLRLAEEADDCRFVATAHMVLGEIDLDTGAFAAARAHLEQAIAIFVGQAIVIDGFATRVDLWVRSLCWLAWAHWGAGYPEQAVTSMRAALARAQALQQPFTLITTLTLGTLFEVFRGHTEQLAEHAAALSQLTTEKGLRMFSGVSLLLNGLALVAQGQYATGIETCVQGTGAWQATEAVVGRAELMLLLAGAYQRAGDTDLALATIEEALRIVEDIGFRMAEAELWRLHGELLVQQGSAAAEADFRRALEIARRQGMRIWELRTAVSLAQLLQPRNRDEALALVAPVYASFTEGFDEPDLQRARAILAQLSR